MESERAAVVGGTEQQAAVGEQSASDAQAATISAESGAPIRGGSKRTFSSNEADSTSVGHHKRRKTGDVKDLVNMTLDRRQYHEAPSESSGEDRTEIQLLSLSKNLSGYLRIPCNAKGMPTDHNDRTAYFIVGSAVKHGDPLLCTHLECQKQGLKFKYCSFCQGPVAKLNFNTRHDHSARKSEGSDESQDGTISRNQAGIPYQVTTNQALGTDESTTNSSEQQKALKMIAGKKVSAESTSSNLGSGNTSSETQTNTSGDSNSLRQSGLSSTSSVLSSSRGSDEASSQRVANPEAPGAGDAVAANNADNGLSNNLDTLSTTRRYEWARLLGQRPRTDDRETMSQWLLDVLAISDFNEPLIVNASSSPTTDASNDSSSENQGNNSGSMGSSALTDQSGTAGSSSNDGSSAHDSSSDTRDANNQDSNDSANDSASDTQKPSNAKA